MILENTFLSLPRLVPTALPVLGPFAFLCHQKWDSASKVPLIPAETPMLLLSGVRDEVVPHEHMQGLWELVQKRVPGGQKAAPNPAPYFAPEDGEDKDKDKEGGASKAKDESVTNPAGTGYSRFVEFARGTHSTSYLARWVARRSYLVIFGG